MAVFHSRLAKPLTSEHWLLLPSWASCNTPLCVHVLCVCTCVCAPVLLMIFFMIFLMKFSEGIS